MGAKRSKNLVNLKFIKKREYSTGPFNVFSFIFSSFKLKMMNGQSLKIDSSFFPREFYSHEALPHPVIKSTNLHTTFHTCL